MVVAKIEKLDTWALFLYEKFTGVLRIVFWKFFTFVEMVFNYLFGGTEDDIVYVQDLMEEESPAANPIFNIISAVVFVILALALLFLFVKAIISIIKSLSVRREVQTQTIEDEGMIEIREKIVRKRNQKKEILSKLRRIYKKAIERNIKKGYELKKYQTPRERAEDIQELMKEDIFVLNSLYEQERYGQFND